MKMENTPAAFALAPFDERQSKIVEVRFFGGLSLEETADALKISARRRAA